jgi:hypothetical protein
MAPKYEKQKDYTKALMLAGMASERLRSLVNFKHIEEWGSSKWNTDYSTDIFNSMNDFPVENVIEYQKFLQTGAHSEFDRFLIARCYKNDDYVNELIGTKFMRLEKFAEAIPYLSKVSHAYIKNMNIYIYFHLDPFREVYEKRKLSEPYPSYKLNFAKEMLELQQKMQTEENRDKKAAAIWQYAIALKRSVSEQESWALTEYYLSAAYEWDGCNYDFLTERQKTLLKRSETLIAQAGKIMQNSKEPAVRAKYEWYKMEPLSFNWNPVQWQPNETCNSFAEKYKNTPVLNEYLSECDYLASYIKTQYLPQYMSEKWAYLQ